MVRTESSDDLSTKNLRERQHDDAAFDDIQPSPRAFWPGHLRPRCAAAFGRILEAREYGPNAPPVRYPEPDVIVLDERFAKYKIGNTPIQRLHTGCSVGRRAGLERRRPLSVVERYPERRANPLVEEDGHVSMFRNPAGNSNGNTFDYQGRQISCEHGNRRVVRYEHDGNVTVLADKFDGKPLNAPNDASSIPTATSGSPIPATAA